MPDDDQLLDQLDADWEAVKQEVEAFVEKS
jgi:hypothetical protein